MTLIPYPGMEAPTAAVQRQEGHAAVKRNLSLDRTRTFLTVLVVIHHSVIAYTYFGHTDPKSTVLFDMIVLANDSFFMAMFYFLSGIFLWPSLARREPGVFAKDRLLRLGLPFAIAALTVIPLAYYALALQQNTATSFAAFWWKTVTVGPWPSGPVWFVWFLLVLDIVGGLLYRLAPNALVPLNRLACGAREKPFGFFLTFLVITLIAYVPLRVYFGPNYWFEFGPFSLQASRVLLYASCFFLGASVGSSKLQEGLLSVDGALAKNAWPYAIIALASYCALWGLIYIKRVPLENASPLPDWYEASYGVAFTIFSGALAFTILSVFLKYMAYGRSILDPMQNAAYGIFLVHYPFVLWLQFWLFNVDLPALVKAPIVFALALPLSWATTEALRKIPGATQVL